MQENKMWQNVNKPRLPLKKFVCFKFFSYKNEILKM